MFIFDRCHCSLAAVTPVKYKYDLKIFAYRKISEQNFSNRHPWCITIHNAH